MVLEITCCIIGIILGVVGILGAIIPGIPGPQLAYIAIIIAQIFMNKPFSLGFIIVRGIVMVLLIIVDYYLPILGTKKFGGSKRGNWGCIIGMVVGLFGGAFGLILGPFLGALIGEYIHQNDSKKSIKAAFGSFIGFLSGVVLKFIASIILFVYFIIGCYNHFFLTLDSFSIGADALSSLF